MRNGCFTGCWSKPCQHIDQSLWGACFLAEGSQGNRGYGRQLAGFQNNAVPAGHCRSNLPTGCEHRRIPRSDLEDHAQRLADGIIQMARGYWDHLPVQLVGIAGVVAEHFRDLGHLNTTIADWLARYDRLNLRQGFLPFINQGCDLLHHHAAPRSGEICHPDLLRSLSRLAGLICDRRTTVGIFGQYSAGIRVLQGDHRATARDKLTPNVTLRRVCEPQRAAERLVVGNSVKH